MQGEDSIKEEEGNERGGLKQREKHCSNQELYLKLNLRELYKN